jgi:flagellar protein FliO/FliZ
LLGFSLVTAAALAADPSQVIYPGGAATSSGPATPGAAVGTGPLTIVGVILLAGAGGWLVWRGRKLNFPGRDTRRLVIDETRSLGSRQYLVVASYEGQKLLLGVCPGRIDLLTPLAGAPVQKKS